MKQGRQHYTTRRDSVVEAMSAAKLLSQNAAQSGVSGISLSRGNSLNKSKTSSSAASAATKIYLDTVIVNEIEKCKGSGGSGSGSKAKLSPLEQSPESDSPENIRKSNDKMTKPAAAIGYTTSRPSKKRDLSQTVKNVEISYLTVDDEPGRNHIEISPAPKTTPSFIYNKQPTVDKVNKKRNDGTTSTQQMHTEQKASKVNTYHKSQSSVDQAETTEGMATNTDSSTRPHKTSSSSDMSRKSTDKLIHPTNKVCKPGSGCRGRLIPTVMPTSFPDFDSILGYTTTTYREMLANGNYAFQRLQPYPDVRCMKTLPHKAKLSTNSHNGVWEIPKQQSAFATINYNTVPRHSSYSLYAPYACCEVPKYNMIPPDRLHQNTKVPVTKVDHLNSSLYPNIRKTSDRSTSCSRTPQKQQLGCDPSNEICHITKQAAKPKSKSSAKLPPDVKLTTESTML